MTDPRSRSLVLASGSPRRRELLERLGLSLVVRSSDIDETPLPGESPTTYVERLAREKAQAVAAELADPLAVIVGADTTVEIDGLILAKPDDAGHATEMLERLSGRTHHVHTAVAAVRGGDVRSIVVTTDVTMVHMTPEAISWYVANGEPFDKAGAYAIQGAGAAFVAHVHGSVSNVVGLPLAPTLAMLAELGIHPFD